MTEKEEQATRLKCPNANCATNQPGGKPAEFLCLRTLEKAHPISYKSDDGLLQVEVSPEESWQHSEGCTKESWCCTTCKKTGLWETFGEAVATPSGYANWEEV